MAATSIPKLLGITSKDLVRKLVNIKRLAEDLWEKGLVNFPDFTLHGVEHSESVTRHLAELLRETRLNPPLRQRELFLLGASAYLHDIGMLFSWDSFVQDQLEELIQHDSNVGLLDAEEQRRQAVLNFCSGFGEEQRIQEEVLDKENRAQPRKLKDGELVRQIHHLLSDWLIMRFKTRFGVCDDDEYLYISRISRGHRKVNLRDESYQDDYLGGDPIRVGVLTALLRVADELDYSSRRVRPIHFEMFERELLANPASLGHWIKHFFITSAGPFQFTTLPNGLKKPVFKISAVAGTDSYKELLELYVNKSRREVATDDLEFQLGRAGFEPPDIEVSFRRVASAKPLPPIIESEIADRPYPEFLDDLEEKQTISLLREPTVDKIRKPPTFEDVAQAIGYGLNESRLKYDWVSTDICKVSFEFEVQAYKERRGYTTLFIGSEPLEPVGNVDCRSLTRGYGVTCEARLAKGNTERIYEARFDPPLQPGEKLRYVLKETFYNLFLFTRDEIASRIAAGQWELDEVLEYVSYRIWRPTRTFRAEVVLPVDYQTKRRGYRVLSMVGPRLACPSEKRRICGCFRARKVEKGSRDALCLQVVAPVLFLNYFLVWSPPS